MRIVNVIQNEAGISVCDGCLINILCGVGREIRADQSIVVPLIQLSQAFLSPRSDCHITLCIHISFTVAVKRYIGTDKVQIHLLGIGTSAHCPRNGVVSTQIIFLYSIQILFQFSLCGRNFHSQLIQPVLTDISGVAGLFRTSLLHNGISHAIDHACRFSLGTVCLNVSAVLRIQIGQILQGSAARVVVEQRLVIGHDDVRGGTAAHHDVYLVIRLGSGNSGILHIDVVQFLHLFLNPLGKVVVLSGGSGCSVTSVPNHYVDGYFIAVQVRLSRFGASLSLSCSSIGRSGFFRGSSAFCRRFGGCGRSRASTCPPPSLP